MSGPFPLGRQILLTGVLVPNCVYSKKTHKVSDEFSIIKKTCKDIIKVIHLEPNFLSRFYMLNTVSYFHLYQGFKISLLLIFGSDNPLLWKAVLCTEEHLIAFMASTQ